MKTSNIEQSRDFVDYPIAHSFEQALEHLKNGGQLWREHFETCPDCQEHNEWYDERECNCCYQIMDEQDLNEMFEDKEIDADDLVHLVLV